MSDLVLVATRGLPASGKSTWARRWVEVAPADRARINRDDARAMLHGGWLGTREQERQVTIMCHGAVLDLLRAGVSVVVDDTNLDDDDLAGLWDIADRVGARFRVADFSGVRFETCVARDAGRAGPARVGQSVIYRMYERFVQGRPRPLAVPVLVGTRSGNSVDVVDMTSPVGVSW